MSHEQFFHRDMQEESNIPSTPPNVFTNTVLKIKIKHFYTHNVILCENAAEWDHYSLLHHTQTIMLACLFNVRDQLDGKTKERCGPGRIYRGGGGGGGLLI